MENTILNSLKQQAFFGVPAALRYQRNGSLVIVEIHTDSMENKI